MQPQQRRFAEEYVVDLNATQAAIRAGYSANTAGVQAHKLLKIAEIRTLIDEEMERRTSRTHVTQDKVIRELARIGFANVGQILDDTSGGLLNTLTEDDKAAISSVKTKTSKFPESDEVITEREVKFHDKMKALEQLGRHLGMFTDKVDMKLQSPVIIVDDIPSGTDDADE